jgi:hypothetical protein
MLAVAAAAVPARSAAQSAYRGLPPAALLRAAELAPARERPAILEALLDDPTSTLPALRSAARTGSAQSKLVAIGMLAEMRDAGGVPALLEASRDDDDDVQRAALSALRTIGDPRAASRFRQLVNQGGGGASVKIAAAGLGRIGAASDRAALRALLSHPDAGVGVTAAGALAMLGSDEAAALLLAALDDDNPIVQKNATYALGFVSTPAAEARLQQILDDADGRWKSYAVIALAQRQRAAQTASDQVATLVLLGRGADRIAADWAIEQLTDVDDDRAIEALRELGQRHGALGTKARLRLKLREGR